MAARSSAGGRVCVGRIGAAHGTRGEVKLWSFTQDPMALARYGPLESEDGARRFEIAELRPGKNHLVAHFKGIDDRTAAKALRNLMLYVPRERLPAPDDTETFYHADLVGLAAVTPEGGALGTVVAIHNFGAGDMIEIVPADGGETLLLPFTDAVVPAVDLVAGRIIVIPPAVSE